VVLATANEEEVEDIPLTKINPQGEHHHLKKRMREN